MSYRTEDVSAVNHARAMRVTEIMNDFRLLQHHIAQIRVEPSREEAELCGYKILRRAISQAQAVLNQPFIASLPAPGGDPEQEKAQLRQYV